MNKRSVLLALLAIVLVLFSTIGTSFAYFTTYATAKGGYVIKSEPTAHEEFREKEKQITIKNSDGASPVYVRAKVFSGSEYELVYTYGDGWSKTNYNGVEDGYIYYQIPLEAGESTTVLGAKIDNIPERLKDSDEFNIVVIYESVLAVYDTNGQPVESTSWENGNIQIG